MPDFNSNLLSQALEILRSNENPSISISEKFGPILKDFFSTPGAEHNFVEGLDNMSILAYSRASIHELLRRVGARSDTGLGKAMSNWRKCFEALWTQPKSLYALNKMEASGGEPALVEVKRTAFIIQDTCLEIPQERNLNYLNVIQEVETFGVKLFDEMSYLETQKIASEKFGRYYDLETNTWLLPTSRGIKKRNLEAVYGFANEDGVIVQKNTFDSTETRGWRGWIKVIKP